MSQLPERIVAVERRIAEAAARAGRSAEEVRLIAVTKTVPVERIREAIAAGLTRFGENRVQEALPKIDAIGADVEWHLIGHLQRNKARRAVERFDWIHSIDSVRLLQRVDRIATELGRSPRLLVQVNTSGEPSKFGVAPEQVTAILEAAAGCETVTIDGLMTIGPLTDDREAIRRAFRLLRTLAEEARGLGSPRVPMTHLSMGMTADFEIAIEEGATMVRVGSAIFGPRRTT